MGCLFRVCYVILSVRYLADEERWRERERAGSSSWCSGLWSVILTFPVPIHLFKVINWIISIYVVF